MKSPSPNFHSSIIGLIALISLTTSVLWQNQEKRCKASSTDLKSDCAFSLPVSLSSGGDFLGLYSTIQSPSPNPYPIEVVSFASLNGGSTSLSNPLSTIQFIQNGNFLPTNTTAYNPAFKQLVCLLSGEEQMLTYDDNPMSSNLLNVGPVTATAPVFLQGTYYGILIENEGYATGPVVDFELAYIDFATGLQSGVAPFQFSPGNPGFYLFNHENMSSATNRMDELYFLSGSNLVIIQNPNQFNPAMCWIDLAPSNTPTNYVKFSGLEYRSPGVLMAIRETNLNGTNVATDLVQITFNSTTCQVNGITVLYDLMTQLMPTPAGWVVNSEYYSTTFDTCAQRYYLSSLFDMTSGSRLVEIDLQLVTHAEQTFPEYLFGIEWKHNPCPCKAAFTYELIDSCQTFQFINTSTGSNLTFSWNFDDLPSGQNNTSILANPIHKFTTCGQYNVCMTATGPGCDTTICQVVSLMDLVPPVAVCISNLVLVLDNNCMATLTVPDIDGGSFDDCQLQSLAISPNTFNACGIYPVTLTVTDWCGNTSTCISQVQVVDLIAPVISCPSDLYLTTSGSNCTMTVPGGQLAVFISDNCGTPSLTYTITGASTYSGTGMASGLSFNVGTSFVSYTAMDHCGNTATCSFKVVVDCICNCENNMIQNSGFNQGSMTGNLGYALYPGHTNDWFRASETPWVDHTTFCCDPFSIYFYAHRTGGESIYQQGIPFVAGHTYKISYCSKSNLSYGFQSTQSPVPTSYNPYNCSNCENIGVSAQAIASAWKTYTIPLWTATQNADVLVIRGIGTGLNYHNTGHIDNICVQEISYSCCGELKAFEDNASLLVNVRVDQSDEVVLFDVGPLLECNRIAYVDWGDGSPQTIGPIQANTRLTHNYPDTNSYEIQYLVQEFAAGDTSQVCFEKIFSQSVQIEPDSCFCNAFSSLIIRSTDGAISMPLSCQDPAVALPCPSVGSGYSFTGLFECSGTTCQDTNSISWRLSGPQESQVGLASTNPYFSIDLLPTYFSIPGIYTLTLSGLCGNEVCDCEIQFAVECQDLCPCASQDIEAFEAAVSMGFTKTIFNNSCTVCFTPNALSDCETVTWFINDTTNSPLGYTNGNETFCYAFQGPDEYSVMMQVDREEGVALTCQTFSYEEVIEISCLIDQDCNAELILNPSFDEGAIAGNLSTDGSTDYWTAIAGSPILLNGSAGSSDGWTIQLTGNLSVADVLATTDPICFPKGRGKVTGKNKVEHWGDPHENLNGKHLKDWKGKLVLFQGNEFELGNCPANSCFEIASLDLSQVDTGWFEFQVEYDLDQWTTATTCTIPGMAEVGIEARLAIFVTSPYTTDQGEPQSRARMQIDQLCLNDFAVSIQSVERLLPIRIYPNPNQSELVVELQEPASPYTKIRIISLTGDVLNDISVRSGTGVQYINTEHLTTGMYFLQLISNGQVNSVSKFVKL